MRSIGLTNTSAMDAEADFLKPPASPRLHINPATVIVVCAMALAALGLTILFSASISFKQPTYYLYKQLGGVCGAIVLGVVASRLDLEGLRKYSWIFYGITAGLLLFVLIPHIGITVNGSRRWLGFGPVRLQVSEIGKLAIVYCLAHYLAVNQTRLAEFKRGYFIPLCMIGLPVALIAREPDLGTAALALCVGMLLLFLAGAKWRYIIPTIVMAVGAFALIVMLMPNRQSRFMAFLDVEANKQAGTYQLYQSLAAFASGGSTGVGLGEGRQQIYFLPEAHTDFIFAVVGEELGLWFTLGVVIIFMIMFIAGLIHLRRAPNLFQYLLVSGCLLLISLQAIINLGVVTGLFPTKGMSLPFISAGLSNLLLMGTLVGILVNTQRSWPRAPLSRSERIMKDVVET